MSFQPPGKNPGPSSSESPPSESDKSYREALAAGKAMQSGNDVSVLQRVVDTCENALPHNQNDRARKKDIYNFLIDALLQQGKFDKAIGRSEEIINDLKMKNKDDLEPRFDPNIPSFQCYRIFALTSARRHLDAYRIGGEAMAEAKSFYDKEGLQLDPNAIKVLKENMLFLQRERYVGGSGSGQATKSLIAQNFLPIFKDAELTDNPKALGYQADSLFIVGKMINGDHTLSSHDAAAEAHLKRAIGIMKNRGWPRRKEAERELSVAFLRTIAKPGDHDKDPSVTIEGAKKALSRLASEKDASALGEGCENAVLFCFRTKQYDAMIDLSEGAIGKLEEQTSPRLLRIRKHRMASFVMLNDPAKVLSESDAIEPLGRHNDSLQVTLSSYRAYAHFERNNHEASLENMRSAVKKIESKTMESSTRLDTLKKAEDICYKTNGPSEFLTMTQALSHFLREEKSSDLPKLCLLRADAHSSLENQTKILEETAAALPISKGDNDVSMQAKLHGHRAQAYEKLKQPQDAQQERKTAAFFRAAAESRKKQLSLPVDRGRT